MKKGFIVKMVHRFNHWFSYIYIDRYGYSKEKKIFETYALALAAIPNVSDRLKSQYLFIITEVYYDTKNYS